MRTFLLTGMVVMAHKVMERDALERIRRMIGMTSLMRMLEEEKEQAIAEAVAKAEEKAAARLEQELAQAEEKAAAQVAQAEEKAAAQVAQAEEKAAAQVAQAEKKAAARLAQEKAEEAAKLEKEKEETERGMARRMLSDGIPPRTVLQYSTLLSLRDIEALAGKN